MHLRIAALLALEISLLSVLLSAGNITFDRDVAPIVFRSCSPCHRPGESAPFPLLTYQDVRKHASQIVSVTRKRYMPPWLPEAGYGDFAGNRRLSEQELRTISDWVDQGKVEGAPSDLPPAPRFNDGWQLGPPDLIVQLPAPYELPAEGKDVFRNFILPVKLATAKYVQAFELHPGNNRLVHHANMFLDRRRTLRKQDGADGQPGFAGMDLASEARSDSFEPDSHFLFWKPGTVIRPEPEGMNWRLDPDSDLILNMHLKPSGREELIQPELGLYFSSKPPRYSPMLLQLEDDGAIDIPPGATDFAVADHLVLPVSVRLLAIYPHAHNLGKRIEAWANLPDGSRCPLIKIHDWDQNWQAVYTYKEPVALPKGSLIEMRITYDNSIANSRNPHSPPVRVHAGPGSEDEMGHIWLQVLPDANGPGDGRMLLQQALMERRLEKYPRDFVAHCNLGGLFSLRRDFAKAATQYAEAVRLQPANATARNGLGAALVAEGHIDEAIPQLESALALDPAHLNARWNLAHCLVLKSDLNGAAAQLQKLLKQQPEHGDAQAGLAGVYTLQGRYDDALPHLREAIRLRPDDTDVLANLGVLLARRGDFEEAIGKFSEVLRRRPADEVTRKYLAQAQAKLAAQH